MSETLRDRHPVSAADHRSKTGRTRDGTDLTIVCPGVRGTVARAFEAMGAAGVQVEGYAGYSNVGHVLVDDADRASVALKAAGIDVRANHEVLIVSVEKHPEALGEILRRIADAGVGLSLLYSAADGRAVIGGDDLEAARAALS